MSDAQDCPRPVRRALMKQQWRDLAYIHFQYSVDEVAKVLPPGLEVDVCDGSAWVGLIPFSMRGIGVPRLPAVPYLGSFPEINVRTYVRHNGVPGVWFCSLDINRLLPVLVARTTYTLPYNFGKASNKLVNDQLHTSVKRIWPRGGAGTRIEVQILEPILEPTPLEIFLSARWGLYTTTRRGALRYAPISHPRWELNRAKILTLDDSLIQAAGFPSPQKEINGEPHVMFSRGVAVRIGLPRRVQTL